MSVVTVILIYNGMRTVRNYDTPQCPGLTDCAKQNMYNLCARRLQVKVKSNGQHTYFYTANIIFPMYWGLDEVYQLAIYNHI